MRFCVLIVFLSFFFFSIFYLKIASFCSFGWKRRGLTFFLLTQYMHAFFVFYLLSLSNVLFELTNLAKRMSFKCELVGSFRVKIQVNMVF